MWQLYGEAMELASQLLPATHALTIDAQKAAASALDRCSSGPSTEATVATASEGPGPPGPDPVASMESSTETPATHVAKRKASLPSEEIPKAKDSPKLPELSSPLEDEEFLSQLPSMLLSKNRKPLFNRSTTMPSLRRESRETVMTAEEKSNASKTRRNTDSNSHGDWVKRAPPGDVFYRSLPWSFGLPGKSPKNRRKKKKADALATQAHDGPIDPFKDWAKEFMHLENMTLFQRKLRTLDGISSLHTDMKIETKRFRQFMQDLELYGGEEQERLGNNRILYTDAGMKALRMGQQRNEQLRKQAWQTSAWGQKFIEREKQLFGYYGLGKQYEKGIDVKCLRKLMEESFNRTPGERMRRKNEEEQKKKQEMEEAEQQKRELAKIGFRKQKTLARTKTMAKENPHIQTQPARNTRVARTEILQGISTKR